MIRPLGATVLVLVTAATAVAARRPVSLQVTAVRYWSLDSTTRIAIEITGECRYHSERIQNPDRIFFDLIGARPSIDGRRLHAAEVGDKLVRRIRVAETQPGITRVVVDLEAPADFTISQLANPDRMIIEVRPADPSRSAPALAAPSSASPPRPVPALAAPPALKPEPPLSVLPRIAAIKMPVGSRPMQPAPAAPAQAAVLAKPARHTTDGNSSLTRALGLKINRVVIDPGHGGHDQGTLGRRGLMEKDLVLDVALRLGKLIEERMGSEVVYTRTDDTYIPLRSRTELANQKKADLFLSLHANSSPYPRIGGVETYYLNLTRSAEALDLAARENADSERSVYELHDLIQKITLQDKVEESKELAARVQTALQGFESRYNATARNRGIKKAPFVVLIGASMPSILAEIGFLSNSREETLLKKPEHRQKLAEALYQGLSQYAKTLSHVQVARRAESE